MSSPWLVRFGSHERPERRLICVPYAGAGASMYVKWAEALLPGIELLAVQLPGRENRFREPALGSLQEIAEALAPVIADGVEGPIALFGHSMGALIAFETARLLAARGREPEHVFVSSRRAPFIGDAEPPMHLLNDAGFIEELGRRYGSTTLRALDDPDLRALLFPTLRADIKALETHACRPGSSLSCAVTAFAGTDDSRASREAVAGWATATSGPFRAQFFPGGHFYFTEHRAELVRAISAAMAAAPGVSRRAKQA